jgi:phage terminase small subunit
MGLTDKQKAFVEKYLVCFNATQAALEAGYSEKTARQQGSRLLSNVDISEKIQQRLDDLKMSADEALLILANQARASIGDYFFTDKYGTVPINLQDIPKEKLKAVKEIKVTSVPGGIEYQLKLYDAQSAAKEIIRLHRLDGGQSTENLEFKLVYPDKDDG